MPTVSIGRDNLFKSLRKSYSDDEFDELCFEFGIELDEVTTDAESGSIIYKVDIPANRYDLLCLEGLSRALNIFLGNESPPLFKFSKVDSKEVIRVKPSTKVVRKFIVAAILRDVSFDPVSYKSFIDLQDKLHQNICRKRTLVAIGTHDYDSLQGPFTFEALPPKDIKFKPLVPNDRGEISSKDLLDLYNSEPAFKHLKAYVDIIYDSPVYPVVLDKNRTVCSLPPIINSDHSKISETTKNIFIECTATDLTKANIVLDTMVTMFSHLCLDRFTVEQVDVVYESGVETTPNLQSRSMAVPLNDLYGILGLTQLASEDLEKLCQKMQLGPASVDEERNVLTVTVPPTRSDVLHAVDVIEDVGIAYGYNNLPIRSVPNLYTVGGGLPLNSMGDLLREEVARAGFMELLTHGLCDFEDLAAVSRKGPGDESFKGSNCPVVLGDGDYEVVRTTLLPGMLKTVQHNRYMSVKEGIRLFEVSDVVVLDPSSDTGAKNVRRLCALYAGKTAGFEIIHGLVDRILQLLQIAPSEAYASSSAAKATGGVIEGGPWRDGFEYFIRPAQNPTFFPGRCAEVCLKSPRGKSRALVLGSFGILHPEVLNSFEVGDYPASAVEIDLEPML